MKKLNTQQTLIQIARLYTDHPKLHTRHTFARNKDSKLVHPTSDDACQFCVSGLLLRMEGENLIDRNTRLNAVLRLEAAAREKMRCASVVRLNDRHGRNAVIRIAAAAANITVPIRASKLTGA